MNKNADYSLPVSERMKRSPSKNGILYPTDAIGIVKGSPSIKGNVRWSGFKDNRKSSPVTSYAIPAELLTDFLASGLTASEFLELHYVTPLKVTRESQTPLAPPVKAKLKPIETPIPLESKAKRNRIEQNAIAKYGQKVHGYCEVTTPAGRIDFLTSTQLIEFKIAHNWKHAIGQLLTYGFYYPDHQLVLALVGSDAETYLPMAKAHGDRFGIQVLIVTGL